MKQLEHSEAQEEETSSDENQAEEEQSVKKKRTLWPWFLLFVVCIGLIVGAALLGWQEFNKYQLAHQATIDELRVQIDGRATRAQLNQQITPLQQSVGRADGRLAALEQQQQGLTESTEKLYELYGRDENGWKLAEVEYLMSIAQHKLVLEHDFEGAAKTLNAASERIGELADPGLLPVRVQISDEIAQLKTRVRPDLVGMTLLVSRLTRQIVHMKPGYQSRDAEPEPEAVEAIVANTEQDTRSYDQRLVDFMKSLVTIKTSQADDKPSTSTIIIDVTEKLEDNLKLTRWSLLERDAYQYQRLMQQNVELFEQYYDLKQADNADFHESLLSLQKASLKPELPDISGSLRLLKQLQEKREQQPQPEPQPQQEQQESDNG